MTLDTPANRGRIGTAATPPAAAPAPESTGGDEDEQRIARMIIGRERVIGVPRYILILVALHCIHIARIL